MLKNNLLFLLLIFLSACANSSNSMKNNRTFFLDTSAISKYPLPKEYFIKNYQKEELPLYGEKQLQKLQEIIKADISTIKQFQKSDVLNLFGTPILIKNEGVSELWQYKTSTCILNFIWLDNNNIVNSIKTYNLQLDDTNVNDCLKDNLSHAYELNHTLKTESDTPTKAPALKP